YSFQLSAHVASVNLPPPAPTSPSNIVWESETSVLISGTPTIPEGSCLTIEPGVKVMFAPGTQLRIQGKLSVQGTKDKKVLFVSESPSQRWGGIYINKEAKAHIEHAEISGATFGIFASKSNAEISNTKIQNSLVGIGFYGLSYEPPVVDSCRIENNAWGLVTLAGSKAIIKNSSITGGQKGVLVDASSPEFYGNTISNNTQVGVVIYGMGYPRFGGIAINQPGLNTIQNNGITQILAVKGYAFLGYGSGSYMLGGANIITSTDIYTPFTVALDNSVISAMGTYWGTQQVNGTNFVLAGLSQMIYEPVMDPEEIEQLLMDALQYRASGRYQNSKLQCVNCRIFRRLIKN
ncbi:MAG: right-handed parallel beta-helix repeat-containing protein, partial [Bacteroidota bacterium]|nr:right-handed parallel beta-helix repeat-containing protein [Bacteroidota bacterium]